MLKPRRIREFYNHLEEGIAHFEAFQRSVIKRQTNSTTGTKS